MKNRTMQAKHLKAKKFAIKISLENDNHRLAGGSWRIGNIHGYHKPYAYDIGEALKKAMA